MTKMSGPALGIFEFEFFNESDFLLADYCPEGLPAALAQADCKFHSLSCFVRSTRHLPSFFRSYFFSTLGTFCHKFASMNVIIELLTVTMDKTLLNKGLEK
jgi:hypothetical protein